MGSAPKVGNRGQAETLERPDGVVIRHLVQGPSMDVTEYTVPRGFTTGPSDADVSEKAGYVVRGRVEIRIDEGVLVVEAGGAYSLPVGVAHQFTVVDDSVIVQVRHPAGARSPAQT